MKIFYIILWLIPQILAYRILLMCPFPAPSHWLWIRHFAEGLLDQGHHITAVTNFKRPESHPNYTEIVINPSFNIPYYFPKKDIFKMKFNSDFHNLLMWWNVGLLTSEYALNDPKIQKLIASNDFEYDLFILEQFFHESFLAFGYKYQVPIVTIGTFGYADNMDHSMGLLTPWSFVPHIVLSYTDNMTFSQRLYNTFLSIFDLFFRRFYYIPRMQEMMERHFRHVGENGKLPSIYDLEKNISLMLINSHNSIDPPRPSMPGLINVGGVHVKQPKPLPSDIQNYLDNAEDGVIYFSLGSYMKSTDMPQEKFLIILETFKKLKQKVLWKYENENIDNLPSNVMVKKWMPQSDILAHKNIILFITHGGIFGTQEALYYGVPMLFIPLYGDQHRNSIKSVQGGYALSVDFAKLSVENFYSKIAMLLNDNSFKKKAQKVSDLFKDNPRHPLNESIYWIEYVVRHRGAKHLKSAAVHLPWYKYLLIDVFVFCSLIIVFVLCIIYKIIKIILHCIKVDDIKKNI